MLCELPPSRPARPPLRASCGESCIQVVSFGPPTLKVVPANKQQVVSAHPALGNSRFGRNRVTPQVWYQVLKRTGFALFQSRFRLSSFKKTITIACVCLFLKTCIYSTLDLNQATGVGSGKEWEGGSLGRRSSLRCALDFFWAQHQH